jgi:hypothetical protein
MILVNCGLSNTTLIQEYAFIYKSRVAVETVIAGIHIIYMHINTVLVLPHMRVDPILLLKYNKTSVNRPLKKNRILYKPNFK